MHATPFFAFAPWIFRLPSAVRTTTLVFDVPSLGLFCSRLAAWNSLPDYPRDPSRTFDSFCRDLKSFLFSFYWHTQRIRGSVFMRYINLQLTLTWEDSTVVSVTCLLGCSCCLCCHSADVTQILQRSHSHY